METKEREQCYCRVTCKGLESFMQANGWERVTEFSQYGDNKFRRKAVEKYEDFFHLVLCDCPLTWDNEYFYFTFPCMPLIDEEDGISYVENEEFGGILYILAEVMGLVSSSNICKLIDRFDPYDIRHLKMSQIIEYMKSNGWEGVKLVGDEFNVDINNPDYNWSRSGTYDGWRYKKEVDGIVYQSEFAEDYTASSGLRGFINHLRMKIAMFREILKADFSPEWKVDFYDEWEKYAYCQAFNKIYPIYVESEE